MDNVEIYEIGTTPKYRMIANDLHQKIKVGKYLSKIPGERELAEIYNVHVLTANKAVSILVDEGILERSRGRGSFITSQSHGKLLPPVLFLHEIRPQVLNGGHPFYLGLFNTLNNSANKFGMNFQIFDTSTDGSPTTNLVNNINRSLSSTLKLGNFSGLILLLGDYQCLRKELEELGKPYVAISSEKIRKTDGVSNLVGIDYEYAEGTALKYLWEKGCRKMGILAPVTNLHIPDTIATGKKMGMNVKYFKDDIDRAFSWSDGVFVEDDYFVLSNILKFSRFSQERLVCMKNAGLDIPLECMKLEVNSVKLAEFVWEMFTNQIKGEKKCESAILIKPELKKQGGSKNETAKS
jgi:hypothetical protein